MRQRRCLCLSQARCVGMSGMSKHAPSMTPGACSNRTLLAQEATAKIDEYARGMISGSGSTLFEELGLYYIGPVDGHNLDTIISILQGARATLTLALPGSHARTLARLLQAPDTGEQCWCTAPLRRPQGPPVSFQHRAGDSGWGGSCLSKARVPGSAAQRMCRRAHRRGSQSAAATPARLWPRPWPSWVYG